MLSDALKKSFNLNNLIFFSSVVFFVWLLWYFFTGYGGPQELASRLLSLALILQILALYRNDYLYKWLPPRANDLIVIIYVGICLYAMYYFLVNFDDVAIWRQGSYTTHDFIVGLLMFLLVMELSRIAHPVLFWINLFLIVYTMYGYLIPRAFLWDFFWHPGTSLYRIVTSSTVELSTGIYGLYAQISLTVIAAFLTLAAVANGFGAQRAMIAVMRQLAGRSRQMVPQTAVLGSLSVGMVSGSGAANAIVTGSVTIPLMKRFGVPAVFAAAVESAASMGGLIMPPLMGIGAFLMSEFLSVPYWEVVKRGFALAIVYYICLALAVYLLCVRLLPRDEIPRERVPLYDQIKTTLFFTGIAFLILLMGWFRIGELRAALYTAGFMSIVLSAAYLFFQHVLKDENVAGESLLGNIRTAIETHAEMTSYVTFLLATLGIMIGLFTVTGFINRMGGMLLEVGAQNLVAVILLAFVFAWLTGCGIPPTATYIIGAVVIVGPLTELGINPWVAHFFVFLVSVWGELSPPVALAAAVTSRIAGASFMRTAWEALKIAFPITLMTFAIFTRSDMVVNPGWLQVLASVLVLIGTCGITFATFGYFVANRATNIPLRVALALVSFVVIFHPDDNIAMLAAAIVLPVTVFGTWRHRQVAAPKGELQPQPVL
jgi:TRAP transporter 4TM/12TM fusion protein